MRRRGSRIARDIDLEYKAKQKYVNCYSSICKQKTCNKCNYKEYCQVYKKES